MKERKNALRNFSKLFLLAVLSHSGFQADKGTVISVDEEIKVTKFSGSHSCIGFAINEFENVLTILDSSTLDGVLQVYGPPIDPNIDIVQLGLDRQGNININDMQWLATSDPPKDSTSNRFILQNADWTVEFTLFTCDGRLYYTLLPPPPAGFFTGFEADKDQEYS